MNEIQITLETVRMFKRIMRPIAEEGIVPLPEYHEAISQLTSLAEHGRLKPVIVPKLIDQKEAAECWALGTAISSGWNRKELFPSKEKW